MKTITLPGTDLNVSQACLGSTHFGTQIGVEIAFMLMDSFVEQGGNFIDTARVYADFIPGGANASEQTIGSWLRDTGLRDKIVLATKGAHPRLESMQVSRLSDAELRADVEASLRHLQTDFIDLYWLHRDDVAVPVEGIIDTLNALVKEGKIRYFGCSNWTIARIQAANAYAQTQGLSSFIANQPLWSLAKANKDSIKDKTLVLMDDAGMAYHRETGLAAIPYTSQAKGFFTKLAEARLKDSDKRGYDNPTNRARFERASQLAEHYGVGVTAVALSYLNSQPFAVAPVIGPRNLSMLEDSLRDIDLRLTPEEVASLEAL
jgi:aryl-alcohol dehydrogenase-like predicted oxidoreductase